MASKSSPVAKHHFWILFGLAPLFLFIAFLLMLIMVGSSIGQARDAFEKQKKDLNTNPKSVGEVNAMGEQLKTEENNRKILWSRSYQEQYDAGLFAWPVAPEPSNNRAQDEFNRIAKRPLKFGDKFEYVLGVMDKEVLDPTFTRGGYDRLATALAPTRFANGGSYANVLRVVTEWGRLPLETSAFWLALEDFWVQRGLLDSIAQVNAAAAQFEDVTPKDKDAGLKRQFRSRLWDLDLDIGPKEFTEKGKTVTRPGISGTLRNRTNRLQLLGANKTMTVRVWLRPIPPGAKRPGLLDPVPPEKTELPRLPEPDLEYVIRGESVVGRGTLNCPPQVVTRDLPADARITRVEQVFDEATVPVRLVNTVALGMLDHKNRASVLEMPKHLAASEPAVDPNATGGTTGGDNGYGSGQQPRPGGGPGSGKGDGEEENVGVGGGTLPGGRPAGGGAKSGNHKAVLDGNKKRYVKVTNDVRRMPVALSVVIDNDYVSDLMVALTNSPLHFQITQTQWGRYKGTLPGVGEVGSNTPSTPTNPGGGGKDGDDEEQPTPPGGPGGYQGSGGYRPPGAGGTLPPGGTLTTTSTGALPTEAAANLCEFALYGVVSLYEQIPAEEKPKEEPKQEPDPMGQPTDPARPMDPAKPTDPSDKKDDQPKDPADKPKDQPGEKKDPAQTPPPK